MTPAKALHACATAWSVSTVWRKDDHRTTNSVPMQTTWEQFLGDSQCFPCNESNNTETASTAFLE